ncbi:MAG: hypothetical protein VXX55_10660, partial [Planctomycetota bacterium]|nr:hypothetical protein [Planctomycetota bacterium]
SWCAADVYEMQGDIDYMIDPGLLLPNGADTEVIYPDQNPRGTSSRRATPTGPPLPPESEDTQSRLIPLDPSGERMPIGVGVEAQPLPVPNSGDGRSSREVQPAFWQEKSRETSTRKRQRIRLNNVQN